MPLKDQSGWENSCPLIDAVISFIDDYTCQSNKNEAGECLRKLERIREINDGIRTWGNEQWDLLDDAKREIDRLESIIGDLRYEIRAISNP